MKQAQARGYRKKLIVLLHCEYMYKISRFSLEVMDLARDRGLGKKFPSLEQIGEECDWDLEKMSESLRKNYGRHIPKREVKEYIRTNNLDIKAN